MNIQELLERIKRLSEQHLITKQELDDAFHEGKKLAEKHKTHHPSKNGILHSLATLPSTNFYFTLGAIFLGITIIAVGLFILVWEYWETLPLWIKIVIPGITGICAYFAGVYTNKEKKLWLLNSTLYLISGIFIASCLYIVSMEIMQVSKKEKLIEFIFISTNFLILSVIWSALLLLYGISYFVFKKNILMFLSIAAGTGFFFSFTDLLQQQFNVLPISSNSFFYYRWLIIGIDLMILGYIFSSMHKLRLSTIAYISGNIITLSAALSLINSWIISGLNVWELLFPLSILIFLFISTKLHNFAMLLITTIYLIIFISLITNKYFAKTLGWPISLIIAGLVFIFIGFAFLYMHRRYIK